MHRILFASAALAASLGVALAQQPMPMAPPAGMGMGMMMPDPSDTPATKGYKAAMMAMHQGMMGMKATGDADHDFMMMMRPHHQAAVDMAKVAQAMGKDAQVKTLAAEIVSSQEKEIATIDAWMKAHPR